MQTYLRVMIKDNKQYVEDLGVQLEKMGSTPMEGRVFSYLLIANPPEKSFDEILEFLQASKSAVSNALKKLQTTGTVKYITKSGDRKRYFTVDTSNWQKQIQNNVKSFNLFNTFLKEIIEYRSTMNSVEFNEDMKKVLEFQVFISRKLDDAILEWDQR